MSNALDQAEQSKPLELSRQGRRCELHVLEKIRATPAVDVEFASVQDSEPCRVGRVEEVQAFDRRIAAHSGLVQSLPIAFTALVSSRLDKNAR